MRIALVASGYPPALGGVEHHVEQLAVHLAAAGDRVTVVTNRLDARHPPTEVRDAVRILRFPLLVGASDYRYSPAMAWFLRRARGRFDVVHAHSYHTLAAANAVLSDARMVFTPHYHGTGHTRWRAALHRPYRLLGSRIMDHADAVICVSRAEADRVAAGFPRVAERIAVIPNGTRPAAPSPRALADCPLGADDVLTVGRLEHYKGVDRLIRAVALLPRPARLVVVGTGPAGPALRRLAGELGVADRVVLTGRLSDDDLQAALVRAGVVASLSGHEAFGLCLADGLAAGAAVVASDIPAHREVLALAGPGAPGTLVDRDDPAALVAALRAGLAAGRPAVPAALPSWAAVVRQVRAVYRELLDRGRPVTAPAAGRG